MRKIIQFQIYRGDKQYVAEGVNVPVVTQAPTLDELNTNIKEAVSLFLEDESLVNVREDSPCQWSPCQWN